MDGRPRRFPVGMWGGFWKVRVLPLLEQRLRRCASLYTLRIDVDHSLAARMAVEEVLLKTPESMGGESAYGNSPF